MSTIVGLEVSGIRSFGLDEPKAKLKFFHPLTLILGENGCGKTTIIESLKYITTGDAPPGCGKGASFVHDPKMARETQVRGQVKLKFKSVKGLTMVATRSLEATQKAKKLEVKTIDTCIRRENPDGTVDNISSKCVDFEYEMISSLGVSKPILNNVIFCHQEDSNWPLDEGKKVKEKFDAIFNASKYIKCLDNLRKLRKELKDKVKVATEILREKEKWKNMANQRRQELQKQEASLAALSDRKKQLEEDIVPIKKRLNEIAKLEQNHLEIKTKVASKKEKLESLRTTQEELRAAQSEQVKCSDMELIRMIQNFQRDVQEKERELNKIGADIRQGERDMQQNQREIKQVQDCKTDLEFAHSNQVARIDGRNLELKRLVESYAFAEFTGVDNYDDNRAGTVLSMLKDLIQAEQEKIMKRKKEFEKEEAYIQTEIDSLRRKEAALEQDIKSKEKQIADSMQKGRQIKQMLQRNELDFSASSLDSIKSELGQVEKEITAQEGKLDIQKAKDEIEEARRSKREVNLKLEDNKRIVNKLNRQAEARSKLDIHVKEQKDLENKVQYLKRKHADEFEHLFGEIPEENIKNKLDAHTNSLRERSGELRREKEQLNSQKTKLDTNIESNRNQLTRIEQEIRELESKIMKTCQGEDLDKALERSRKLKEDLTHERGDLSSSAFVLNGFREKLKKKPDCPLCHRDFNTKDEVDQLLEELSKKVETIPGRLNSVKGRLETQEKLYDQMVGLKPQQDQANRLRVQADKVRSQMEADLKVLETVRNKLEENGEWLNVTNSDEEMARLVQNDVVTMDNYLKKIRQLTGQIEDLKSSLGGGDGGISMEEAMKQQSDLEEEIRKLQKQETEMQEKLEEHKDQLDFLKERKLKLSTQELELRTKLQETEKLKEEMNKLEVERKKLEEELEKAKKDVAPFKYQIDNKADERKKKMNEKETWVETENNKVRIIQEDFRMTDELQQAVLQYRRSGKEERLTQIREQLTRLESKMESLGARKKTLEEQERQLEKDLSSQKERKRNLDDEKKIRDKDEEAKFLLQDIAELEESIKGSNEETMQEEKCRLRVQFEKMFTECHNIDGNSEAIGCEIKKLQMELRSKELRDAEKNYKDKFIEKKCTDVAADDINKYYKALDTAIMRFHSEKMHTINRIIKSLWQTTYKGNDIDYVEIKTDETESVGADKRRTYQYRVVMVKNGVEMDMRGRCSAGQKVLASLIIRMALAETFSSNCGILALDEPTTNLDSANIESLAHALLNISNTRAVQKNFQLIVITHDREFLHKLTMADYTEYYYKVSRNERGLSTIKRHGVSFL